MEFNFRMLSLAREARGLTQQELVKKIRGLKQSNYSKMEKGTYNVSEDYIDKFSEALNFPVSFFFYNEPIKSTVEYLYRKRLSMTRKEQIKLEANLDLLGIWIETLVNDVEIPEYNLPSIEVAGSNTPEEIARKIRVSMHLPRGPIDKLVYAIEKIGILIYFLEDAPEKFDGTTIVTHRNQRVIVINNNIPNDRKRFTIAHELGHNIMHFSYYDTLDGYRDTEKEANDFASEFLMPERDISKDLTYFRFSKLEELKQYWKASKASLIRRAYKLGFIDSNKFKSMMIELSRTGERKRERNDVQLEKPILLKQIIQAYLTSLEYTIEELLTILRINKDDFESMLYGIDRKAQMKISLV